MRIRCRTRAITASSLYRRTFPIRVHTEPTRFSQWAAPSSESDRGDHAGADRAATFANSESQSFFDSHWVDQLDLHLYVVTGHDHLHPFGQLDVAGHVGSPDVELRAVAAEERRMPAALFLA